MAQPFNFGRRNALLGVVAHVTATGTTAVSSPVYDLQGYAGVACLMSVAVTATGSRLFARGGSASGSLGAIQGSWTTGESTNLLLEMRQPQNCRFVDFVWQASVSGQTRPMYIFGLGGEDLPVTHSTGLSYRFVNQPVTGTASG